MKKLQKLLAITLPMLGAVAVWGTAEGATFSAFGTDCVQNFTTTPQIEFDNSNGTAVNGSSTSTRNFLCTGTSTTDKVLQSVTARVVDRSTSAVECTAFNGAFSVGPVASAGTDASFKDLVLNITDATWVDAFVKCDVPALASGIGSGVNRIFWLTN
jgi:hypothetical protein